MGLTKNIILISSSLALNLGPQSSLVLKYTCNCDTDSEHTLEGFQSWKMRMEGLAINQGGPQMVLSDHLKFKTTLLFKKKIQSNGE